MAATAACTAGSSSGSSSLAASAAIATPTAPAPPSLSPDQPTATAEVTPALAVVTATTLATHLPGGLSRAVAIEIGGRIMVYGGFTDSGSTTDAILRVDPSAARVEPSGHLVVRVHDAAGVALGDRTLIFGGGSAAPSSVVQEVDSSGAARVIGKMPSARADLSAVTVGNAAIVIGGAASGVLDRRVLETEDGIHFRTVATLASGVRYAAVAQSGGRIYLIGGIGAAGERAEIERIDPSSGSVDVIGRTDQPISHASAIVIGGRLLLVGGRSEGKAQDGIWQVDLDTGATHLVGHLPQPVSDFSVAVLDGTGYLIGGETTTQIASIVAIDVR